MFVDWTTVGLMSPEIVLVAMALWIYVAGAFEQAPKIWPWIAAATFIVTLTVVLRFDWKFWNHSQEMHLVASGPLTADFLGQIVRTFAVVVGLLFTLMMWRSGTAELTSERLGTLMLVTAGVMLVARANELVLLFLGLEMVSIPTYVLLFLGRRDRGTAEATVKYFFLSILSSALLLYGFSFLYGLSGSTLLAGSFSFPGLREVLQRGGAAVENVGPLATIALVLVFAGLGFKIAAVPFHFYAPDVYQGTTNANAGLLAVAPKIVGIVALVRITTLLAPAVGALAWQLAMILAILTMTLGNICALWQTNIRRLLGFSSIAHSGYMLIGLSVGLATGGADTGYGGIAATLFYLVVYSFASIGMFAALTFLEDTDRPVNGLEELAGLAKHRPFVAGVLAVCLFSFAGIPIFAGFWGKLALFTSALGLATNAEVPSVGPWFTVLAIVGAINAAIAAAYYLRVIAAMFFHSAKAELPARGGYGPLAATVIAGALVVGVGVLPGPTMQQAQLAEQGTRRTSLAGEQLLPSPTLENDQWAAATR